MRIGVPKEVKPQETRIGLTPESVKILTSNGHEVLVENNGGFEAGFDNEQYKSSGAKIVDKAEDIFNDSAKIPLFIAPSPKNATLIELLLFNLADKAAPVDIPIPPPTIAFAPIMPFSKSEMCIEPP